MKSLSATELGTVGLASNWPLETNQGAMTPEEIGEALMYSSWRWNKLYWGASERTLRGFYGDEPHERFTERYIREGCPPLRKDESK